MEQRNIAASIHPLLIPVVAENIASNLKRNDLLQFRTVCRVWNPIGNEEFKVREDIKGHLGGKENFIVGPFLALMSLSNDPPIVRIHMRINLFTFSSSDLFYVLTFTAPFVREINLTLVATPVPAAPKPDPGIEHVNQLLPRLAESNLSFARLETFVLNFCQVIIYSVGMRHPFGIAVKAIADVIVQGAADNLKDYICIAYPRHGHFVKSLPIPKGIKRMGFHTGNVPYEQLIGAHLHLQAFVDNSNRGQTEVGVADFLDQQKNNLIRLNLKNLEKVYHNSYPNFPELKTLKKLSCDINYNSTFDFLAAFPNLVEVDILVVRLSYGVTKSKEFSIENHSRYPKVRKLRVCFGYGLKEDEMVNVQILSYTFPNLTQLTLATYTEDPEAGHNPEMMWRVLPKVFLHMPALEGLSCQGWTPIGYGDDDGGTSEVVESILVGLPQRMCEGRGTLEVQNESDVVPGLTALKSLKFIEFEAPPKVYDAMFTPVTFHRVWMMMESLKEIRFLGELPDACQPWKEDLLGKGMDLYRMKRRADPIPKFVYF